MKYPQGTNRLTTGGMKAENRPTRAPTTPTQRAGSGLVSSTDSSSSEKNSIVQTASVQTKK